MTEIAGTRMRTLRALCDTFVAPVRPPASQAADPTGFWGRRASDVDAHEHVAAFVLERLPVADRDGLLRLLDVLGGLQLARLPQPAREALLRGLVRASSDVADGIAGLRDLTILSTYGQVGPDGGNPSWAQLGYPGPPEVAAPPRARLRTWQPDGAGGAKAAVELACDVVVVGSGSGGSVVAAEAAAAGLDVVVLEAGGHLEDADFPADELGALRDLYWRGGPTATADGNVTLLAGRAVGGGSTVNWQNCVRPPDAVRVVWAKEHGLHGVDGGAFDADLDAVLSRLGGTLDCGDRNGPNQRLQEGADALGWSWVPVVRNVDPDRYDAASAGHVGFGDRSGAKLGTLRTYLVDAVAAGARLVSRCTVHRVLVDGARAAGVRATIERADGTTTDVTVRAPSVVLAAGALETPAVLLRSGIGGPAAGRHLRLHPVPSLPGFYASDQDAWWGPPMTVVVDEHVDAVGGHGFLVEVPHYHLGISVALVPWRTARRHKLVVGRLARGASFIAVTRDHGSGRVELDERGEAVATYPLDDPVDRQVQQRAVEAMVRLHVAAGARAVVDVHPAMPVWRRGDAVDAYVERLLGLGFGRRQRPLFSAHQMGSARMGDDATTSVADPDGQLHDVRGVWIGDTSAFPTAVGSNPMLTCMALARRTARALLAARP